MPIITNPYLLILDEITPNSNYIPTKKEYVEWFKKHQKTIKTAPYSDFLMPELIWTFKDFETLVGFLEQEYTFILANNRYKLLDQENEIEVLEWLLDFENISEVSEHFYGLHFEWFDDKVEGDKIIVSQELGIKIELTDFKPFIDFEKSFRPLLLQYKEKFTTSDFDAINFPLQVMLTFHKIVDDCGVDIYATELEKFNKKHTF